ncbi:hypothetical protein MSAN_02020000 [Mycena sanguinolenta]|uniref:F-box domain-containing protein n=1 Tax=Mycena sanguinolenta TaxID=230812 RepID=A0A8H6XKD2_9AGAR|nr:hypothetical protein MSAN_02020000 [Mycena sanguinolenta]
MSFHDLDEDVLAQILLLCDIYTVLSFFRVNKSFRCLALSKQLWRSLVFDLSSRHFIPHLDAIQDCTTAQLLAAAKWLVCGPETWTAQAHAPPTVSFSRTFPPGGEARLLPGGRHLAVLRSRNLYCQDVLTGRDIFIRALEPLHTMSWEMEMLDDGHTAIFLFLHSPIGMAPELSILRVDLTMGHSDQLFHLELNQNGGLYNSPIISGDFLALRLKANENQRMIVVINWRELKYVQFNDSNFSEITFANDRLVFLPGHIILVTAASKPPNEQLLVVYTLRSIASRWRPLEELQHNAGLPPEELLISPERISPMIFQRLVHNSRVLRVSQGARLHIGIMLHPNPIRRDAYKVVVYSSDTTPNTSRQGFNRVQGEGRGRGQGTVLFTYAVHASPRVGIRASTDYELSWTRTSAFAIAPEIIRFPLSYAGYAVISSHIRGTSGATRVVDPRPMGGFSTKQTMREVVVISQPPVPASLSSSGVLIVSKDDGIQISCYA